ncbi:DUF3429 domain-containing protein [Altererythrobacter sp. ZODW24]|uniref:DUF3429 domain-containing protein n=1 Tax=Altererythrobacter sp. ZODW24 TaxID=2185142 RepID=UPI000DF7ED8B|nr:DUF3429 domain-containing protein [Altererythrobacter sp. ZODW24]
MAERNRDQLESLPEIAEKLGYAGLLPQVLAVWLVFGEGEWRWVALAGGLAYAALIFSFLGGVWWGQAVASPAAPKWAFAAAVLPSLIGLAAFMPWTVGWNWPGPSLIVLGFGLVASPLVDRALAPGGERWMALRWKLSLGLGVLTLILGILALRS